MPSRVAISYGSAYGHAPAQDGTLRQNSHISKNLDGQVEQRRSRGRSRPKSPVIKAGDTQIQDLKNEFRNENQLAKDEPGAFDGRNQHSMSALNDSNISEKLVDHSATVAQTQRSGNNFAADDTIQSIEHGDPELPNSPHASSNQQYDSPGKPMQEYRSYSLENSIFNDAAFESRQSSVPIGASRGQVPNYHNLRTLQHESDPSYSNNQYKCILEKEFEAGETVTSISKNSSYNAGRTPELSHHEDPITMYNEEKENSNEGSTKARFAKSKPITIRNRKPQKQVSKSRMPIFQNSTLVTSIPSQDIGESSTHEPPLELRPQFPLWKLFRYFFGWKYPQDRFESPIFNEPISLSSGAETVPDRESNFELNCENSQPTYPARIEPTESISYISSLWESIFNTIKPAISCCRTNWLVRMAIALFLLVLAWHVLVLGSSVYRSSGTVLINSEASLLPISGFVSSLFAWLESLSLNQAVPLSDDQFDTIKTELSGKIMSQLQYHLPNAIYVTCDSDGLINIPPHFWQALRELIIGDDELLTLELTDSMDSISERHWNAVASRIHQNGMDGSSSLNIDGVENILKERGPPMWEYWLRQNKQKVAELLHSHLKVDHSGKASNKANVIDKEEMIEFLRTEFFKHRQVMENDLENLQKQLGDISVRISNLPKSMTEPEVKKLVQTHLGDLAAKGQFDSLVQAEIEGFWLGDLQNRINFFSPGNGASTDPRNNSPTWKPTCKLSLWSSWYPFFTHISPHFMGPINALTQFSEPEDCWCAGHANIGKKEDNLPIYDAVTSFQVNTARHIQPEHFVIEHILPDKILDPSAAPKLIEIWAHIENGLRKQDVTDWSHYYFIDPVFRAPPLEDVEFVKIGQFVFSEQDVKRGHRIYSFPALADLGFYTDSFIIRTLGNHGADHTCFYRVRMFGKMHPSAKAIDTDGLRDGAVTDWDKVLAASVTRFAESMTSLPQTELEY